MAILVLFDLPEITKKLKCSQILYYMFASGIEHCPGLYEELRLHKSPQMSAGICSPWLFGKSASTRVGARSRWPQVLQCCDLDVERCCQTPP